MTELPPLPNDLQRLLDAERGTPGPDLGAKEQVFARIEATLAGGSGAADGGGAESVSSASSSTQMPIMGTVGAKLGLGIGLAAVAVVVGVGIGVGSSDKPPQERVPAEAEVLSESESEAESESESEPESEAEAEAEAEPEAEAKAEAKSAAKAGAAAGVRSPPKRRRDTLAEEQSLLEQAHRHLRSGYPSQARKTLLEHERRYGQGKLEEEREALLVLVLVKAGEHDEAARRAQRFRARWPSSLHSATVDAALGQ